MKTCDDTEEAMRTITTVILLLITFATSAFCIETVPPPAQPYASGYTPGYSYGYYGPSAAQMHSATAPRHRSSGFTTWLKKSLGRVEDRQVANEHIQDARYRDLKQAQQGQYEALRQDQQNYYQDLKKENGEIRGAVTNLGNAVNDRADGICDSIFWWGIGFVIAALILLAFYMFFLRRNGRRHVEAQTAAINRLATDNGNHFRDRFRDLDRAVSSTGTAITQARAAIVAETSEVVNERADEILTAISGLSRQIDELPERTATAVRTLDDSDIEFDADGHHVTYRCPAEGIAEGYYLELFVPKDATGDAATYERTPNSNRGVVRRNAKRIMDRYFRKEFDVPEYKLQKELIEHLRATGDLSWRTT